MKEIQNQHLKQQLLAESQFTNQFSFNVTDQVKLMYFSSQSFIVEDNVQPQYLFYLVRGRAKLHHLSNGKTLLVSFFTPPCFIGEMELIDPNSIPFNMQAITDCYCLALPIHLFQHRLLNDAIFLKNICVYLSHKNVNDIQTAAKNQAFTLEQRLAALILLTEHQGIYNEKHTEIAQYFGVSYRHLLYILARLVNQQILRKQGHKYYINNVYALTTLAQEVINSVDR